MTLRRRISAYSHARCCAAKKALDERLPLDQLREELEIEITRQT
jgi:hypothetical protein